MASTQFMKLEPQAPMYFFVPKDFDVLAEYEKGFGVSELFVVNSVGIVTARDAVLVNDSKEELLKNVENFYQNKADENLVQKISYRPFDNKFIYYDVKLVGRARERVMQHFLRGENWGLVFKFGNAEKNSSPIYATKNLIDFRSWSRPGMQGGDYTAPLYLYNQETSLSPTTRTPNLNHKIIAEISQKLSLKFIPDHELPEATSKDNFSPLDLLDYIYATLNSPSYREKYKEFLKIDFPHVPYPSDSQEFWRLVAIGSELRKTHLLEGEKFNGVRNLITKYSIAGSNKVETIKGLLQIPKQFLHKFL